MGRATNIAWRYFPRGTLLRRRLSEVIRAKWRKLSPQIFTFWVVFMNHMLIVTRRMLDIPNSFQPTVRRQNHRGTVRTIMITSSQPTYPSMVGGSGGRSAYADLPPSWDSAHCHQEVTIIHVSVALDSAHYPDYAAIIHTTLLSACDRNMCALS